MVACVQVRDELARLHGIHSRKGPKNLSCQRVELIHPYVDRELDVVQTSEVERHLEQCEECNLVYRSQIALRSFLHDASFYYRAPADLKGRIKSSVQEEAEGSPKAHTATSSAVNSRQ
jgi:anti-sigma factor RsiW